MDQKVNEIDREVDELTKNFNNFLYRFERIEQKIDSLARETGAGQGRELGTQVDQMQEKIDTMDRRMVQIERDVQATRKLVEYGDTRLKEIMKALSIIYRNTDELESNLLEAESLETGG